MLFLTSRDVAALVTMTDVVEALEAGYAAHGRGEVADVPRENLRPPTGDGSLKAMPAAGPQGLGGILYTGGFRGRPEGTVSKLTVLFDGEHGDLACVIESDRLSWLRTGATSGVATDHLARDDVSRLGLVGSGRQARSQLLGVAAVRDLDEVVVYSPTRANRERFAAEMADRVDADVRPVSSARAAVEGSDVVCTATTSPEPVLDGEWLAPGTHVNAIGAHYPDQREVDEETVRRCRVVVDALDRARKEEGELIIPAGTGAFDWDDAVELGAVVAGDVPGREDEDETTLMTSGGLSMEYLVTGRLVYDRAVEAGVGTELLGDAAPGTGRT